MTDAFQRFARNGICSVDGCGRHRKSRGFCQMHYLRWRKHGDVAARNGVRERFRKFVKPGGEQDCWQWTGGSRGNLLKYGVFRTELGSEYAHRASYRMFRGEIPDGLIVRHKCDNPLCVNPAHLEVGTHKQNAADMHERGRNGTLRGKDSNLTKLSEKDVLSIRERRRAGESLSTIARAYSVQKSNISLIVNHKTWRHLP